MGYEPATLGLLRYTAITAYRGIRSRGKNTASVPQQRIIACGISLY